MGSSSRAAAFCALCVCLCLITACGSKSSIPAYAAASTSASAPDPLASYTLSGDTQPVHDPSIIRQGNTYYSFTTDVLGLPPGKYLPIRCSTDKLNWSSCGSIFPAAMPAWVVAKVPGIAGLWAPDVSYFNGLYHVYYAGSTLGSQRSVIGLVTNVTLDPTDSRYQWVDRGEIMESSPGDDFNAIDPNILVDTNGDIWMTYGSYWSGIKQRQIDPATGMLSALNPTRYDLATRPSVPNNPIEGSSLVYHEGYYYLFVSIDYCCNANIQTDDYKEVFGRATSPHGPFVDEQGVPMMQGGGTLMLQGDGVWNAPGGGTVYLDPDSGDSLIVFHALNMQQNGALYLWLKQIVWQSGWPVLSQG